jgi:subtilisin family serine protease
MVQRTRRTFLKVSGAVLGGIAAGTQVTAATRTDRFIVETKGKRGLGGLDVVHEMPGVDLAVVRGDSKTLKRSRAVKKFAPDVELFLDGPGSPPQPVEEDLTDESLYPLQWDKRAIDAAEAQKTTRGEGTTIGVIDTGIDVDHPDIAPVVDEGLSRNFVGDDPDPDDFGDRGYHGTFVAGVAAADDRNDIGVGGVAPGADVAGLRVFPGQVDQGASFADILAAIVYGTNRGMDVLNLSLGAYPVPRQGLGEFYGGTLNKVMTFANKEGTLLVIAAGNDAANLQQDGGVISLPNEGAQAVSVSATAPVGFAPGVEPDAPAYRPASYTNYGTNAITIGAPGGDFVAGGTVTDLVPGPAPPEYVQEEFGEPGLYIFAAGTSFAAPQVAGAAALVKSANPNYNANQVEAALKRAAEVPDEYDKAFYGSGFLNVPDAL